MTLPLSSPIERTAALGGAVIRLDVPGTPAPKGSARAVIRGARAISIPSGSDANKARLASWKAEMLAAIRCCDNRLNGFTGNAIVCACVFRFPMRKGDLGTGANAMRPKHGVHAYLTSKPDVDKLLRSTLDAITASGVIWRDDSQAIVMGARVYVPPGMPVMSTVLLGTDIAEVTAAWLAECKAAEETMENAKRREARKAEAA